MWFIFIAIYIVVLVLTISASMAEYDLQTSSDWVKVIFWPITVSIFLIGVILWLLIWVPRKLFEGMLLCFDDIEDFFINIFCDATGKKK